MPYNLRFAILLCNIDFISSMFVFEELRLGCRGEGGLRDTLSAAFSSHVDNQNIYTS